MQHLTFPQHIYDQNRIALATEILQKELRKLFLGLPAESWGFIDASITGWANDPVKYHLESEKLRDFWDIFAAFMESIKLKTRFTTMFTARNMSWSKKTLRIRDIQMTSPLHQLEKVPGLNLRSDLPFAELMDILADKPEIIEQQRKIVDEHSTDPTQDTFRIITLRTKEGLYRAMDGNRRTLRALLCGKSMIDAWVGDLKGDEAKDFWLPINDMFQLVQMFDRARTNNDKQVIGSVAMVLKNYFLASAVAEVAYKTRIANQSKSAARLYDLAKQL